MPGDFIFSVVPVFMMVMFILIFGIIIFTLIKAGAQWKNNNNSPVLIVNARIVSKRISVTNHMHNHGDNMGMMHHSSSTTYFTTFEVESGDRIELKVPAEEYGMLAEGDNGKLTFQGTRYKGFERIK